MATYTQLGGQGVPTEELSGEKTFLFGNSLDATVYFTMEQVRNADGFYSGSIARNAEGTFGSFTGLDENDLITSPYKWSIVIPPNSTTALNFTPTATVAAGSSMLRATGDITLTIS